MNSMQVGARVLATLLAELDGVSSRSGVYILAAAGSAAALDDALVTSFHCNILKYEFV
jgi:SpoVK/Ycf46/Vps4 family AAA+-type ATPase